MVVVVPSSRFEKAFKKIKHQSVKQHIILEIQKIGKNPLIGKPMRFDRLGTREVYISPYRLSYVVEGNALTILDLYHKDEQ